MPLCACAALAMLLCILLPPSAQAEEAARAADWSLYAGIWDYGVSGAIADQGYLVSLDSNGGVKVNPQAQLLLHYDYRGGWWPDLSVGYAHLGGTGTQLATGSYQIGGITVISGKTALQGGINFNDYDISLDWRLLCRPHLRVEAGLEAKYLDGHADIVGTTTENLLGIPGIPYGTPQVQETPLSLHQTVPLLHLRAEASVWSRLSLEFSGGFIAYEGDHAGELRAVADLHLWKPLFITAGYQEQVYKVRDNPYIIDARIDGPTLGITIDTP